MEKNTIAKEIFTLTGFLSPDECDHFIELSERSGYDAATIETERGAKLVADVRNNHRVLFPSEELASKLWERVSGFVPMKIGNSEAVGLNELFRFYRYGAGEQFKKHTDDSFIRNEEEASYYTFMIYLNDSYEGGGTSFDTVTVKGEKGMGLVFLHSLPHAGAEVISGVKYVLRTDIMYRLKAE